MAKSKSVRTSSNLERTANNQIVQQWRAIRAEVSKVTWPTREEAQKLTIAVTIGMIIMAIFLYLADALFQVMVGGLLDLNIVWLIASIIMAAVLTFLFYTNSQEE